MPQKPSDPAAQAKVALEDLDLPRIHFNGFINSLTTGDVVLVLQQNGRPVALLNISYTVAKTLAEKLATLIQTLEERTGNTIMTIDDIAAKLAHFEAGEKTDDETP